MLDKTLIVCYNKRRLDCRKEMFMKFTDSQKEAIKATNGIYLVNSGAGSGKTTVFTMRIASLVQNGVDPSSILGLTFTKNAADNMKKRLVKYLTKDEVLDIQLSTFHSFARKVLFENYPEEYIGTDVPKAWWKMQTANAIVGEESKYNPHGLNMDISVGDFLTFVSYQKSLGVARGESIVYDKKAQYYGGKSLLQKGFDKYCELAYNAKAVDYDDMLLDLYVKLKTDKELLEKLKAQYQYISVDEFQDTSDINLKIIKMLCTGNLFVVGDFRQSIMSFNNSNINNILKFQESFKDVKLIELCENFRSTKRIVDIANDLIEASPIQEYKKFDKQVAGRDILGKEVMISVYNDGFEEVESVSSKALEAVRIYGMNYSDVAILCRTNAELALYEQVFADKEIPVRLSSQGSFFDRKEIADLLAYLKHIANRDDDMSFRQIVNVPTRYITNASMIELDGYAKSHDMTLEKAIEDYVGFKHRKSYYRLINLFDELEEERHSKPNRVLNQLVHKLGYRSYIETKSNTTQDAYNRLEALDRLLEMSRKYPTIDAFLAQIDIIKANSQTKGDAINIMTVHASKGLEFQDVFVTGVTEAHYPHQMCIGDIEEERRLLYVAMTRAVSRLHISYGVIEGKSTVGVSPFLEDIAKHELKSARQAVMGGVPKVEFGYKGSL